MLVSNETKRPQKVVVFCFRFVMTPIRLQHLENYMQLEELEGYWLVVITYSKGTQCSPYQTTIMLYYSTESKTLCSTLRALLLVAFWHAQLASILCYKYPSFVSSPICYPAWWEELSVF